MEAARHIYNPNNNLWAEAWTPTKAEEGALQKILDNIIKRILKTPTTTPSELTTADTGIWDI